MKYISCENLLAMSIEDRAGKITNISESALILKEETHGYWENPEEGIDSFDISISHSETAQKIEVIQRGRKLFDGYQYRSPDPSTSAMIGETKIILTTTPNTSSIFVQFALDNGDFLRLNGTYSRENKVFKGKIEHEDNISRYPDKSQYSVLHTGQNVQITPHQFTGLPGTTHWVVTEWYDIGLNAALEVLDRGNKLLSR